MNQKINYEKKTNPKDRLLVKKTTPNKQYKERKQTLKIDC